MFLSFFLRCALCLGTILSFNLLGGNLKVSETGGKFSVVHPIMQITIDPLRGGRIERLDLNNGVELVPQGKQYGLLLDHFAQQRWPGELLDAPYTIISCTNDSKRFSIKMRRKIDGGKHKKEIGQLIFTKTITLSADSFAIDVEYSIHNPTNEMRRPEFWVQNVLWIHQKRSAKSEENIYLRPSRTGINKATVKGTLKNIEKQTGEVWVTEPVAGWTATLAPQLKSGLVMVTDYNDTYRFYNCLPSRTMEVFYDKFLLPPGKTWKTKVLLRPLEGITHLTFADKNVVLDMGIDYKKKNVEIFTAIAATVLPNKKPYDIVPNLKRLRDKNRLFDKRYKLNTLGYFPEKTTETRPNTSFNTNILFSVNLHFSPAYEFVIPCVKRMIYQKNAGAMQAFGSTYSVKRPKKSKKLFKPVSIEKVFNDKLDVLVVNGLFSPHWKIKETLSKFPETHVVNSNHRVPVNSPDCIGELSYFPEDYKDLMSYDIIILINIPAGAIGEIGQEYLKDFVKYGGALIVLGGRYAYAGGEYAETPIATILPVTIKDYFDVKPCRAQLKEKKMGKGFVAWMHDVGLKKDANVVLHAGKKPFWVISKYGNGNVAACLGTVEGIAPDGKKLFFNKSEWINFLKSEIKRMVPKS